MKDRGVARTVAAVVIVFGGVGLISPSFETDSDRDGAADVTEINVLGTDPSKPNVHSTSVVAARPRR